MPRLHSLLIKNFRGIASFSHTFHDSNLFCFIGRGDSGKTTVLEAIYAALAPQWNLSFHDGDFHNGNHENPIEIEVTLLNLPDELLHDSKFGLYIRGWNAEANTLHDQLEDGHQHALTVRLEVSGDLEPHWTIINERQEPKPISASERSKFNVCYVSDYVDRHFSWNKGNPLYTLLSQYKDGEVEKSGIVLKALRDAKKIIDDYDFAEFEEAITAIKEKTASLGLDISKTSTSIDFKDILSKEGRFSLHEEKIPFRLKGKGSKRLISLAIQTALCKSGGIILVDELEQSLEPDRAQHAASVLTKQTESQIFLTTHSASVVTELQAPNLLLLKKSQETAVTFSPELQGCLRKNPSAFFAKKILVCEGATEVGILRSINTFRLSKDMKSFSFNGVCLVDGTGNTLLKYSEGFAQSLFDVCLFCDSDVDSVNDEKQRLKDLGIKIVDWADNESLEDAIALNLPEEIMYDLLNCAAAIRRDESEISLDEAKTALWDSVKSKYGADCPEAFADAPLDERLRRAIGKASASKGTPWFKTNANGERLGDLILSKYDCLENNELKVQLDSLTDWIDGN